MTNKTLAKARTIHKAGGVECGYPGYYTVKSTSGRVYDVDIRRDRCDCPAARTCSHITAVHLYRAARRRRLGESLAVAL